MRKDIRVKPGKAQSLLGFVVGIFFVFMGFTFVESFGIFGMVWTGMAICITVINGINAFSSKGIASSHIEIQQDDVEQSGTYSVEDRLKEAQSLYEKGLISKEELERKRQEILQSL